MFIVRDLIHYGGLGTGYVWLLHALFVVWLLHAVLNQVSQRSTATLVVESWRYLLGLHKKKPGYLMMNVFVVWFFVPQHVMQGFVFFSKLVETWGRYGLWEQAVGSGHKPNVHGSIGA